MSGCVTSPTTEEQAYLAYSVGDRTRVTFDEIVASLSLKNANGLYQNLHVTLAATVNPVKTTHDPYMVAGILQRLDARISARVVEVLTGLNGQSLEETPRLGAQIATEAQSVVDQAMRQWQHGSEYEVKILVVSLYWTDTSVGRIPTPRRSSW
jgi:hypothetical protein